MKNIFRILLFLFAVTASAQYAPSTNVNYIKFLKVPPISTDPIDSVLVYDHSSSFMKMVPGSFYRWNFQQMYDADPNNLVVTDGSSTTTIAPEKYEISGGGNVTTVEQGSVRVTNGDRTGDLSETAVGVGELSTSRRMAFDLEVGIIQTNQDGSAKTVILSDNVTEDYNIQQPNITGGGDHTPAFSVTIGATDYPAGTDGAIDLTGAVPDASGFVQNPMTANIDADTFNIENIGILGVTSDAYIGGGAYITGNIEAGGDIVANNASVTNNISAATFNSGTLSGNNSGDQTATTVPNTPAGNISATDVQAAINELDSEKQASLVSGTNIKTVGGTSLLGSGDVTEVQNSLSASTVLAPSATAVNTALAAKKCMTMMFQHTPINFADSQTYYFGGSYGFAPTTTSIRRVPAGISGTITDVSGAFYPSTAGSAENSTLSIKNVTSNTTVTVTSSLQMNALSNVFSSTISLVVAKGDELEIIITTPAWVTNPLTTYGVVQALITN